MSTADTINKIAGAVATVVATTVTAPINDAPPTQAQQIAEQAATIAKSNPAIQEIAAVATNNANAEPWYQSRVTLGALLGIGTSLAGIFGIAVSPEDSEAILGVAMAAGTVIGGALTLYGRWVAKKPLGN